uniref:DNA-binding protein inhibitor ID-4 n=4 Tax=Canis lupus TaxID=9612 RepID=A0A8C0TK36_CANLF
MKRRGKIPKRTSAPSGTASFGRRCKPGLEWRAAEGPAPRAPRPAASAASAAGGPRVPAAHPRSCPRELLRPFSPPWGAHQPGATPTPLALLRTPTHGADPPEGPSHWPEPHSPRWHRPPDWLPAPPRPRPRPPGRSGRPVPRPPPPPHHAEPPPSPPPSAHPPARPARPGPARLRSALAATPPASRPRPRGARLYKGSCAAGGARAYGRRAWEPGGGGGRAAVGAPERVTGEPGAASPAFRSRPGAAPERRSPREARSGRAVRCWARGRRQLRGAPSADRARRARRRGQRSRSRSRSRPRAGARSSPARPPACLARAGESARAGRRAQGAGRAMKAVSPVRPSGRKAPSGCGGGELALRCLAEHGHGLGGSAAAAAAAAAARCKAAEAAADEPALCLQCDMNDCYSRLRRLVPTIPPNKKVSKVEILQHVIDYILDLQLALETHPALLRQPPPPAPPHHPAGTCPAAPPRTPLTALNTDPAGAVNKQGDSILCR